LGGLFRFKLELGFLFFLSFGRIRASKNFLTKDLSVCAWSKILCFLFQYGLNLLKASCFGLNNSQASKQPVLNSNPMMSGDSFSVPSSIGGFPQEQNANPNPKPDPNPAVKKKRNLPGTPGKLKHVFFFFFF
jgi:hypothetical protein